MSSPFKSFFNGVFGNSDGVQWAKWPVEASSDFVVFGLLSSLLSAALFIVK